MNKDESLMEWDCRVTIAALLEPLHPGVGHLSHGMVPLLKITLQNVLCQTKLDYQHQTFLENEMRAALLTGKRFVSLYFFNYCSIVNCSLINLA